MANWHFWGEKKFSDVYENIYIRSVMEDWFNIIFEVVNEINSTEIKNKKILDIGCGEGHSTKQILDRVEGDYECDLLEPNVNALNSAEAFLIQENEIRNIFPRSLAEIKIEEKYDIIFTSHTNYYWAMNEKDYRQQLNKLIEMLNGKGKIIILTLPENSDHYKIMLRQIYPKFNYAEYITNFFNEKGLNVKTTKMKMKMYVGDILSTDKSFDLKTFYKFIHNTDAFPNEEESKDFLNKIKQYQEDNHLDFRDYILVIEK